MSDEPEDEVKLWPAAVCTECGHPFPKDQDWARKCFLCWKDSRGYDLTKGDKCFLWSQVELTRIVEETSKMQRHYRREVEKLKAALSTPEGPSEGAGLDARLLRDVISLCHPDKHGDSSRATKVTQELLALRAKLKKQG